MDKKYLTSVLWAILAAALYALSAPVSKLLLKELAPTLMASLLYFGAGIGMVLIGFIRNKRGKVSSEMKLSKKEIPYTLAMVGLDIIAPILLLLGLRLTSPATVALINNFEIVATSLIALLIFKERISKRLWCSIVLITISCMVLSIGDIKNLSFSYGALFVVLAAICWGFENNCTRMLSVKDPMQVVIIKGFGAGAGSLIISLILGENSAKVVYIIIGLLLGFVAYGLSIYFYVYAQRELGAAKTSAYYAVAPFIGVGLSFILFFQIPSFSFIIALLIMVIGTYLATTDNL